LLFDPARTAARAHVGTNAGELISEAALAIELGADGADIGLTCTRTPTLSETLASRPRRSTAR